MTEELNLYGVFVPSLFLWMLLALGILLILRHALVYSNAYSMIWHRPLFDLALYVIVLGAVVYLSKWFST